MRGLEGIPSLSRKESTLLHTNTISPNSACLASSPWFAKFQVARLDRWLTFCFKLSSKMSETHLIISNKFHHDTNYGGTSPQSRARLGDLPRFCWVISLASKIFIHASRLSSPPIPARVDKRLWSSKSGHPVLAALKAISPCASWKSACPTSTTHTWVGWRWQPALTCADYELSAAFDSKSCLSWPHAGLQTAWTESDRLNSWRYQTSWILTLDLCLRSILVAWLRTSQTKDEFDNCPGLTLSDDSYCSFFFFTLSLHCLYIVFTLSLHCLYIVFTLSLHCLYIVFTLSLHCLYM